MTQTQNTQSKKHFLELHRQRCELDRQRMKGVVSEGFKDQMITLLVQLGQSVWEFHPTFGCVRRLMQYCELIIYLALPDDYAGPVIVEGDRVHEHRLGVFPSKAIALSVCARYLQSFKATQQLALSPCKETFFDLYLKPAAPSDEVTHHTVEDWFQPFDVFSEVIHQAASLAEQESIEAKRLES